MSCRKCKYPLQASWHYCPKCGQTIPTAADSGSRQKAEESEITVQCPNCGALNSINHHFCTMCGHDLETTLLDYYKRLTSQASALGAAEGSTESDYKVDSERFMTNYQQIRSLDAKATQVLDAFGEQTKYDYSTIVKGFFRIGIIGIPLQLLLLLLALEMRHHSHTVSNTIFLDGIILSGIANIISFSASLLLIINNKISSRKR